MSASPRTEVSGGLTSLLAPFPEPLPAPAPLHNPALERPERLRLLVLQSRPVPRGWVHPWCLSRVRRVLDIVGAMLLLVVAVPVFIAVAVAIRLESPGPIFFRQWRTGLAGKRFRLWKFRTMRKDAEQMKETVRLLNHHGPNSPDFKARNDPRVTAVGRSLRRWSLDELPNVINVLQGDMSIVGPRPTSFGIDAYEDWHLRRLAVPPGLTGLWQISGRSELDFDDRVVLDCRYIQSQSLFLDLKILMLTPFCVLGGRGAC